MANVINMGGSGANTESKTVKSSQTQQTIIPPDGVDGFNPVIVNPFTLQSKSITPGEMPYTIRPDTGYDGLSMVTVQKDSNLLPGNILKGKTIYGVTGTYESVLVQAKCTQNNSLPASRMVFSLPESFLSANYLIAFYFSCSGTDSQNDTILQNFMGIPGGSSILGTYLWRTNTFGGLAKIGTPSSNPSSIQNFTMTCNKSDKSCIVSGFTDISGSSLYVAGSCYLQLIGYSGSAIS